MVLYNTNKNNSILLEVLASVFTVSSNVPDNPRMLNIFNSFEENHLKISSIPLNYLQNITYP